MNWKERPSIEAIMRTASRGSGATLSQLRSESRESFVCDGRIIFARLAKHYGYRNYEIGWALDKWRTAVTYYLKRAEERMIDPFYRAKMDGMIVSLERKEKAETVKTLT